MKIILTKGKSFGDDSLDVWLFPETPEDKDFLRRNYYPLKGIGPMPIKEYEELKNKFEDKVTLCT